MAIKERRLRVDAERNRRRLLDAATELFRERGLEVGVGEIAERAGVGRGTLFRNFPTKEQLIAAIVVERIKEVIVSGERRLDAADPGAALFELVEEMAGRQQTDRALFEAIGDTFLANPEIRAGHAQLVAVIDQLVARAQAAGAVREDVGALDVMMLMKGACEVAAAFQQVDPSFCERQLDLVRAALTPQPGAEPLRGRTPTVGDIERAFPSEDSR